MLVSFYHRCSLAIVLFLVATVPVVAWFADCVPTNNDLEIWMPEHSAARIEYEEFKQEFGSEEFILIALDFQPPDPALVEAVCRRLEELPEFRRCWSPDRMQKAMSDFGVADAEAQQRLSGLVASPDGRLAGIVALLSDVGTQDRSVATRRIHEVLDYCQIDDETSMVAGTPVFVSELDRLGSREANLRYFIVTLVICLGLLFVTLRNVRLTVLVFQMTVWAISIVLVLIGWYQGETNLILNSISVLVMVFTMTVALHYLHYYFDGPAEPPAPRSRAAAERAVAAMKRAAPPTCLASLTTAIGDISLAWSDIRPVQQFAYAATLGTAIALILGLLGTPALMTVFPVVVRSGQRTTTFGPRMIDWTIRWRRPIVVVSLATLVLALSGLSGLRSNMEPMSYLPDDSAAVSDFQRIENELTRIEGFEAVVDFGIQPMAFSDQLSTLRRIEGKLKSHPAVDQTMSLASFFPDPLPSSAVEVTNLFQKALDQQSDDEFTARQMQRWRISARIRVDDANPRQATLDELALRVAGEPVRFTGLSPLIDAAQHEIFDGFWESVFTAFLLILVVMVVSMRSIKLGVLAMLPNLWPVTLVFGGLGWIGGNVDIAMLLSGSIAMGIAVDGTFHFVERYKGWQKRTNNWERSIRNAFLESGLSLTQATLITAAGLLGLTLSGFGPTVRFGVLMILMLLAALVGDLILLPALLTFTERRRTRKAKQGAIPAPEATPAPASAVAA